MAVALPSEVMLTYADFAAFPDDGLRRELLEGEIVVSPSPDTRHQNVLGRLFVAFVNYLAVRGCGQVFVAPYDVVLADHTVVEPDLVFVADGDLDVITEANIQGAPTPPSSIVERTDTSMSTTLATGDPGLTGTTAAGEHKATLSGSSDRRIGQAVLLRPG